MRDIHEAANRIMSASRRTMAPDELLKHFVARFESGAQGCEMDCDSAQAVAQAISRLTAERDAMRKALEAERGRCLAIVAGCSIRFAPNCSGLLQTQIDLARADIAAALATTSDTDAERAPGGAK